MDLSIDLRFLFPPLLNLIKFFLFLRSHDGISWDVKDGTTKILLYLILKLQLRFLIPVVIMLLLLFLLTPIRLTVSVSPSISVSRGEPSVLLAISLVASVFVAPSLFLEAYLCLILLSLCYATLASLFKRCLNCILRIMINRVDRNQEIAENVDEENIIEAETNHIQNLQPSSTDDDESNLEVVVAIWCPCVCPIYMYICVYFWCHCRVLVNTLSSFHFLIS